MLSWSFCFPAADADPWLRRGGIENVRVARDAERVTACLLLIPMGQFFGGASVPMTGIAGVATPAAVRGAGGARRLVLATMRELHAQRVALSALYPATIGLYRSAGYEIAGARYEVRVDPNAVGMRDRGLRLREIGDEDREAVEAAYRTAAVAKAGHVDRGPYVWHRVRTPRGADQTRGFLVEGARGVEGYAYLFEKRLPSGDYTLHASDLVALTGAAHRRLHTLVADHGTLAQSFAWNGAPNDPFAQLLPRTGTTYTVTNPWMLRVTHVGAALEARGWPAHVRAAVDLDVADDVIPENAGRWSLRVEGGRAEVTRGGAASVRIDVRALASLYSGWMDARALAAMGALDASDADVATLGALFAGPSPWMPDFF
jgi:predicted acetyltransferase